MKLDGIHDETAATARGEPGARTVSPRTLVGSISGPSR